MSPLQGWIQCPLVGAERRIQWLFEDKREGGRGGGGRKGERKGNGREEDGEERRKKMRRERGVPR